MQDKKSKDKSAPEKKKGHIESDKIGEQEGEKKGEKKGGKKVPPPSEPQVDTFGRAAA